ncbi:MAG: prepilin-type N-terminal cleavage/methylation domain-containing protein [Planctomycetota bacterium]|jgi:prepilin-type N-terminal cleavage/methylation domain-containing protein
MNNTRYKNGLTLIELLVAMVVVGVVMTAVATLAYALSSANDSTDDMSRKQAQVRFASLRISDLIRHCKIICCATGDDLAIWRADDNDDGQINISELVYIECGSAQDHLQLCEFPSSDNTAISLSSIGALATGWWSAYSSDVNYTRLILQCSNVQFGLDVLPPQSGFVSVSFDVVENDIGRQYQITAALRGWAGNLLDDSGNIVSDDD